MHEAITLGVEEEYLLVDRHTRALASRPPREFMERCVDALGERVSPEYLQSQVEIGTRVCGSVAEVRAELAELRGTLSQIAAAFDLAIYAASTHPFGNWHEEAPTDKERYVVLTREHAALVRRLLVCGMHVHAGVPDGDRRIDLMNQVSYFLPHFLALTTSSPFWQGEATGLKAYRPTIMGDLPRSGLPEPLAGEEDWAALQRTLAGAFGIDDGSKIWWDVRPSVNHPTLEMRACDMCTRLEDAVTLAALYQATLASLSTLRARNQTWRHYRRILIAENKWLAQRDGVGAALGDLGRGRPVPFADLVEEIVELVGEAADALGCRAEVERARAIVSGGTSADAQLDVFRAARTAGADDRQAQCRVVDWVVETTLEGTAAAGGGVSSCEAARAG